MDPSKSNECPRLGRFKGSLAGSTNGIISVSLSLKSAVTSVSLAPTKVAVGFRNRLIEKKTSRGVAKRAMLE